VRSLPFRYYDTDSVEDPEGARAAVQDGLDQAVRAWDARRHAAGLEVDADAASCLFVLDAQEVHMLRDALTGWQGKRQVALQEQFAEYVEGFREHGLLDA